MNKISILSLITSLAFVGACKVDTPDGRIPTKHIRTAQAYQGNYYGQMNGQSTQFSIQIANDGYAQFLFAGDIVGPNCNSRIGQLQSVWSNSKRVGVAWFKLQSMCNIEGQEVEVDFKNDGRATIKILADSRQVPRQVCNNYTSCDTSGFCVSSPECHVEMTEHQQHLRGEFQRY